MEIHFSLVDLTLKAVRLCVGFVLLIGSVM